MAKDFCNLYADQEDFQRLLLRKGMYGNVGYSEVPSNNIKLFSYHIQAIISELGEVLEADRRWKKYRNGKYDRGSKLEEIADCFITLMNIAIFSGYYGDEVEKAICDKIKKNFGRVNKNSKKKKGD